jgi:hypothetical protein
MKKLPKHFFVKIKHNLIMANSSPKLQGTLLFSKKIPTQTITQGQKLSQSGHPALSCQLLLYPTMG